MPSYHGYSVVVCCYIRQANIFLTVGNCYALIQYLITTTLGPDVALLGSQELVFKIVSRSAYKRVMCTFPKHVWNIAHK